jgi:hypothetical protein
MTHHQFKKNVKNESENNHTKLEKKKKKKTRSRPDLGQTDAVGLAGCEHLKPLWP